jgi:hypothetical protein
LAIFAAIRRASGGPVFLGSELRQADNVIPMERIKPNSRLEREKRPEVIRSHKSVDIY